MNAAIAGCGTIADLHAECLKKIDTVRLIAAADTISDRAERFGIKFGCAAYGSLECMLTEQDVDVLHICTPHYLHVPMAIYAMKLGIHVFMEKPPVISREQWKALNALRTEARLGICFQNRYNPSVQYVKRLLESGKTGKVIGGRAFVTWKREADYYKKSGWRGEKDTEGGGVLINQAVHTLDLLTYFLGPGRWVSAALSNHHLAGIINVEDTIDALIGFESGARVCFYATTANCVNENVMIDLYCEHMNIRMEGSMAYCLYPDGRQEILEAEVGWRQEKSYWGRGHQDCITDFYNCIQTGETFGLGLDQTKNTTALVLAAYESGYGRGVRTDVGLL